MRVRDKSQRVHELKTWPIPFDDLAKGRKCHEVRVNDRKYVVGDALRLMEYDPESGQYFGRFIEATVTHITYGGNFGLPDNLCVMSLAFLECPGRGSA